MVYNNANMKDALDDNNENENQGPVKESIEGSTLFKNAEIYLTHCNHKKIAKATIGRKRKAVGNFIRRAHQNPLLDSRVFTVRFPDGVEKDMTYNVIAEHLFSRVDKEEN